MDQNRPQLNSIKPATKTSIESSSAKLFEDCLFSNNNKNEHSIFNVNVFKGVDYIDNVLTQSECLSLCKLCDNCEDFKFWNSAGRSDAARQFRDADTIELNSKILSSATWDRIKHILSCVNISVSDDENDVNWERELVGEWEACSLNDNLLFAKYPSQGAFSPHTDGRAIHDFNTRSFFSVIIFLNDIPEGGGTSFYTNEATKNLHLISSDVSGSRWAADESFVIDTVSAVAGRMLIFNQSLVHEGVPALPPFCKYIIRSDVMFKRTPAICAEPRDLEAYSIFREAEDLAERGIFLSDINGSHFNGYLRTFIESHMDTHLNVFIYILIYVYLYLHTYYRNGRRGDSIL